MSFFVFMDLDYMRRGSGWLRFWKKDKGSLKSVLKKNIQYLWPESQLAWTSLDGCGSQMDPVSNAYALKNLKNKAMKHVQ